MMQHHSKTRNCKPCCIAEVKVEGDVVIPEAGSGRPHSSELLLILEILHDLNIL